MIKTTPPRPLVQTSSKPRPDEGPTYLVHLVPLRRRGRGFGRGRYDELEGFVLDEPTEGETMDRNPHEIVTLDDQPEGERYEDGEGYELGRAYGSPKDDEPAYEREHRHCAACEDAAKWPGGWDAISYDPFTGAEPLEPRKPMRIRYMELPGEINPNTHELTTPFVIVIDRVTGGDISEMLGNAIALNTGARGVLAFEQEIQIGDD